MQRALILMRLNPHVLLQTLVKLYMGIVRRTVFLLKCIITYIVA